MFYINLTTLNQYSKLNDGTNYLVIHDLKKNKILKYLILS